MSVTDAIVKGMGFNSAPAGKMLNLFHLCVTVSNLDIKDADENGRALFLVIFQA